MQTKKIVEQALQLSQISKLPTDCGEIDFSAQQKFAEFGLAENCQFFNSLYLSYVIKAKPKRSLMA